MANDLLAAKAFGMYVRSEWFPKIAMWVIGKLQPTYATRKIQMQLLKITMLI